MNHTSRLAFNAFSAVFLNYVLIRILFVYVTIIISHVFNIISTSSKASLTWSESIWALKALLERSWMVKGLLKHGVSIYSMMSLPWIGYIVVPWRSVKLDSSRVRILLQLVSSIVYFISIYDKNS